MSNFYTPSFESEAELEFQPAIPEVLPMEKMYNIQVGNKSYNISGASLSSDSPSYFTNHFSKLENADKTLFIDRSPRVFDKIIMHLQGYYLEVLSPMEFVYLFSDAFYFSLPRLQELLYKFDIFADIGNHAFKFSKKIISSEGNYPNFFSIAYNSIFRDPTTLLASKNVVRPPPQAPIALPDRCPKLFAMIVDFLKGYDRAIDSSVLRGALIRECRYYHFLALEQKLVAHHIFINPFTLNEEILLYLDNIKRKGLSICLDGDQKQNNASNTASNDDLSNFTVNLAQPELYTAVKYRRPYMDIKERDLVVQIDSNETFLMFDKYSRTVKLKFVNDISKTVRNTFKQLVDNPIINSTSFQFTQAESDKIQTATIANAEILKSTHLKLNGVELKEGWIDDLLSQQSQEELVLSVVKSQWKVEVKLDEAKFVAIKLEGVTSNFNWNRQLDFL